MTPIRFRRDWRGYRAGPVFEFADGMANVLIARGIADAVTIPATVTVEQSPTPEARTMTPVPTITLDQPRRKRG